MPVQPPPAARAHRQPAAGRSRGALLRSDGGAPSRVIHAKTPPRNPARFTEVGRVRIGKAEVAFETLGRSGPVVVFESGQGENMRSWEHVAHPLAACARVVLYDRPGIGRSSPRTVASVLLAGTVVDQLAALLHAIDMPPLYILVGHSLGAFYAQAFARKHPAEVAAVVLVDAASPFEPPGVFVSTVPPKPGSIEAAEEAGFAPSVRAMP